MKRFKIVNLVIQELREICNLNKSIFNLKLQKTMVRVVRFLNKFKRFMNKSKMNKI